MKTLVIGLLSDALTTLWALAIAIVLAVFFSLPFLLFVTGNRIAGFVSSYYRGLVIALVLAAVGLFLVSTVDVGYYRYNHQHVDFVFFEFVDELLHAVRQETPSQAAEQTTAELNDAGKWILYVSGFLCLEALIISLGVAGFRRSVARFPQWKGRHLYLITVILAITLGSRAAGINSLGPSLAHVLEIENETYSSLSQNPILSAQQPLRDVFLSQWGWTPATLPVSMDMEQAVQITQAFLGGATFPISRYPLVREHHGFNGVVFNRPANIILIFVEGLDRRYVGQEIAVTQAGHILSDLLPTVRLTPFLDRLREDSVYFEHFFSNGVQTTRGLYATLCSAFPRQGTSVIKTRNANDYLCLPFLLHNAGYRTEMVVSLDSDLPGLRPFLERNGLDRLYSERDFPADAERRGIGLTDRALFEFLHTRIETLQSDKTPFFLAAMTSGTHHPFTVPLQHADVRALQKDPDRYLAALRYFDLEFERFFDSLTKKDLLTNTMVLVLGDHGRHEPTGRTDLERQAGHFLAPLFIWLDPSLRRGDTYRPHTVDRIASQVDVAPTVLAMNGLAPRLSPFVGQDVSCLLIGDCLLSDHAFLSSVYDDLIGLADQSGLWLYSFRKRSMTRADLSLNDFSQASLHEPEAAWHYHQMVALYLATNLLIEQNRMWSWNELGHKL